MNAVMCVQFLTQKRHHAALLKRYGFLEPTLKGIVVDGLGFRVILTFLFV